MDAARLLRSVKEVGAALGISPWTVRRLISERKLVSVRVGRRVLVEPAECRRLIETGRSVLWIGSGEACTSGAHESGPVQIEA